MYITYRDTAIRMTYTIEIDNIITCYLPTNPAPQECANISTPEPLQTAVFLFFIKIKSTIFSPQKSLMPKVWDRVFMAPSDPSIFELILTKAPGFPIKGAKIHPNKQTYCTHASLSALVANSLQGDFKVLLTTYCTKPYIAEISVISETACVSHHATCICLEHTTCPMLLLSVFSGTWAQGILGSRQSLLESALAENMSKHEPGHILEYILKCVSLFRLSINCRL